MKKKIIKCILFLFTLTLFSHCNKIAEDIIDEDYQKLFPFTGVDKPEISYEDMTKKQCDPDEPSKNFVYPGVSIPEAREYDVTIKCVYNGDGTGTSRYEIKYVDENQKIQTIGSYAHNANLSFVLASGEEYKRTFKVKSGHPMYLCVNGVAPRNTNVKASISAISTDGIIVTPTLGTAQYQNQEGPNKVEVPYCEYIILP